MAAVKKRVPVFIGCTNLNPREAIRQAKFAQEAGADGLLLGVSFYYQATVDNAVQFYHDVADALSKMCVMIYHNPTHHRVTIPVSAFKKLTEKPNTVGLKDSHRTRLQFVELCDITKGKMSAFVNQTKCSLTSSSAPLVAGRNGLDGSIAGDQVVLCLSGIGLGNGQTDLSRFGGHRPGRCQHRQSLGPENMFKCVTSDPVTPLTVRGQLSRKSEGKGKRLRLLEKLCEK